MYILQMIEKNHSLEIVPAALLRACALEQLTVPSDPLGRIAMQAIAG